VVGCLHSEYAMHRHGQADVAHSCVMLAGVQQLQRR
jgi:hypothetical protein